MKNVILDVDTGLDDMVALLLAFASDELKVAGIVASHGNKPRSFTLPNTQHVVRYLGLDIPVFAGSEHPLVRPQLPGGNIHGKDGLAEFPFGYTDTQDAPDGIAFLRDTVLAHPGAYTIVSTGPLTDVARVITRCPEWIGKTELVHMGGSFQGGNITPYAEFNIFADPEAAGIVYSSGLKTTLFPLDVTTKITLGEKELEFGKRKTSKAWKLFSHGMQWYYDICTRTIRECPAMHDACTIASLIQPELFEGKKDQSVTVNTDPSSPRYGETTPTKEKGAIDIMLKGDNEGFWRLFNERVEALS